MRVEKLPAYIRDVIESNNGYRMYLGQLQRGKPFTRRSWLYEDVSASAVLSEWKTILSTQLVHGKYEQNVLQLEWSQLEKWGPQGGVKPISQLMDIVTSGFTKDNALSFSGFSSPQWKRAKLHVSDALRALRLNLRPREFTATVNDMRKRYTLDSNSGFPDFTRRSKPEVLQHAKLACETGRWKTYPATALFRNYNNKTRLVWMFPIAANIKEATFMQPLQEALIERYSAGTLQSSLLRMIAPWVGFEEVRNIISDRYNRGEFIAASDFSETDAHFTIAHSEEVCDVLQFAFQPQYRREFREVLTHMHSIPLIISTSEMLTGMHGVSSGSTFTNFVETIFDIIFAEYVRLTLKSYSGLYAIGDDMSWISVQYNDAFSQQLEALGKEVGHVIKEEKTTNDRDKVKSLQRLFQRGYFLEGSTTVRAVYPTIRALKSSIYPERFHNPKVWSSDMFCARQFMILENCVDHPLFNEFVAFICKGSKYLIPFAQKSTNELNEISRESRSIPGLTSTYNQEKRDQSLASFKAIAIAAKL